MMKNYIIGFTASVFFGAPLLAQSSEPIVALDLPPETVPVVAVDAHNGGIQYTGKTRPLAEIVRALGNSGSTFDTTDPPTAVMQNPDGSWGAYNIPVDKLDRGFGGDGKVAPAPVNDPGAQGDVPLDRNSLDGIPVVAPDTRSGRGGVSLTGEYLSRETVAASRRPGSIEKYGDATALIRTASGRLVVYSQPLARLDMKYGGDGVVGLAPDGVHAFEGAEPIQLIGTGLEQLEQFPEWKGPIEVELARDSETSNPEAIDLFPDDMSGDWKMTRPKSLPLENLLGESFLRKRPPRKALISCPQNSYQTAIFTAAGRHQAQIHGARFRQR